MAEKYIRGKTLGSGTWGCVYEAYLIDATHPEGRSKVAIKKVEGREGGRDGLDFTAIREIKYLRELMNRPFVVQLLEVFISGQALHLVLEHCAHDLEKVIRHPSIELKAEHIKCYMQMILKGVAHCHDKFILHRDLKPANILIKSTGELCITDFGLARSFGSPVAFTSDVVTRWYKAPELLFGSNYYSSSIDIWAIGCIFAELFLREPLFPGNSDTDQLTQIFNIVGTPTKENWPNVKFLPKFMELEPRDNLLHLIVTDKMDVSQRVNFTGLLAFRSELELVLLMLMLNPLDRISANKALNHSYFIRPPVACIHTDLQLP